MIQLRMADFNTSDTFTSVNQTSFHGSGRTWPACLSPPRVFMSGGRYTYMSWNLWLNRLFMAMVWVTWHDTWRSLAQVISGPSKVWQWFRAFICWYARFNLIRFRFRCHHFKPYYSEMIHWTRRSAQQLARRDWDRLLLHHWKGVVWEFVRSLS